MSELHLVWTANGKILRGFDPASGQWDDDVFSHGPLFPGTVTDWKEIYLNSSCLTDQSNAVITELKLFLEADADTTKVLKEMSDEGHGVQVSFNSGETYICLTDRPKYIASEAIITSQNSTYLRPYDSARFHFRVSIPPDFKHVGKLVYRVSADFDVI